MAHLCILLVDLAMFGVLVYFTLRLRQFLAPHLHPDAPAPRPHGWRRHLHHRRHRHRGHTRRNPFI